MPRTIGQAEALEAAGVGIDVALLIEISDARAEERLTGRRVCVRCGATYHIRTNPPESAGICDGCGCALEMREDDRPETVKNRLSVYHRETEPLIGFYKARGKLITVEDQPTIEATTKVIFKALGI
jgi:adenylate kinase